MWDGGGLAAPYVAPQVELETSPDEWAPTAWFVLSVNPANPRYVRVQAPGVDEVVDRNELGYLVTSARAKFEHALANQVFA